MLPPLGKRVSLRYRLAEGGQRPYTDVIGHVEASGSEIRIRTRHGELVTVEATALQAFRVIPEQPVRTSQIRNLEHAAAYGWPGTEQQWVDGWLLRFGGGHTRRANSAIPLDAWASPATVPAIVEWYAERGVAPLISAPDRLFRVPPGVPTEGENLVMVGTPRRMTVWPGYDVAPYPNELWRAVDPRGVPDDVLTASIDGEVAFVTHPGVAAARGAITEAPDGTRWVGLSAVHVTKAERRRGRGRGVCQAVLNWAHRRGATRAYLQTEVGNDAAVDLFEAMGFTTQHRVRYVDARNL